MLPRSLSVGSSPRLRGTRLRDLGVVLHAGIIPALAGNTRCARRAPIWTRDHPRACGEHLPVALDDARRQGSSPRLRGTRPSCHYTGGHSRIIPALAGNTRFTFPCRVRRRDHPRACGEHAIASRKSPVNAGSSPRLRGTRRQRPDVRQGEGIIPALAGNTM